MRTALALAARAPSIHNSQPWRWVVGPRSVHLHTDLRRRLPATDAQGRDLIVSCGAVLHHLRAALAAAGLPSSVRRVPNPAEPDHLAALELHPQPACEADLGLAAAISRRRTDRRKFTDWEVPRALVDELTERATEQGVLLRPITAAAPRARLLDAIGEAAEIQDDDVAYRTETAVWSGGYADVDGVPAANLLRDPVTTGAGTARRFSDGLIEQTAGEPDGAALLVLATASDDALAQLRAGEALSAVLLHATALGLATCPLSQPLGVGSSRQIVQDEVLGGSAVPQLAVRVGWAPAGAPLPPTPRRPIDETIERLRV